MKELEVLMKVSDLTAYLGCTPQFIYNEVKRGSLKTLRIGKNLRFSKKDVHEWMNTSLKKEG